MNPNRHGAGDVVALDARFSTLLAFDAGELFDFAVKLLDFPVHAAHLLCGMRAILSQVIGTKLESETAQERLRQPCIFVLKIITDSASRCPIYSPRLLRVSFSSAGTWPLPSARYSCDIAEKRQCPIDRWNA